MKSLADGGLQSNAYMQLPNDEMKKGNIALCISEEGQGEIIFSSAKQVNAGMLICMMHGCMIRKL